MILKTLINNKIFKIKTNKKIINKQVKTKGGKK